MTLVVSKDFLCQTLLPVSCPGIRHTTDLFVVPDDSDDLICRPRMKGCPDGPAIAQHWGKLLGWDVAWWRVVCGCIVGGGLAALSACGLGCSAEAVQGWSAEEGQG